jgi:hypothetical protein
MINPNISLFNDLKDIKVSNQFKYVFVNDFFASDLFGGAELTSEALIASIGENEVFRIRSQNITENFILENLDKVFIFGNFTMINGKLLPLISMVSKYIVIEYDYKFCKQRNVEKHKADEKKECDCHTQGIGKVIEDFYQNAKCIFWMSELQKKYYTDRFPSLNKVQSIVLSSVFTKETIENLLELRSNRRVEFDKYVVLDSSSWVKGKETTIKYCKNNNIDFEVIGNLKPEDFLTEISKYKGIVYMPNGADTCPRMIIEAKILGLEIITNDLVQHANEEWFSTDNIDSIIEYLQNRPEVFAKTLQNIRNSLFNKTLSGYTTTFNCKKNEYPFISSIKSMASFCDEVIVLDGGSDDGTYEDLLELSKLDNKIKVHQCIKDWKNESKAEFDGFQKARARDLTTKDFCWQFDVDELVTPRSGQKVQELVLNFPNKLDLMAVPVIEFWGAKGKIRTDINPWKWRLSRNKQNITHGIPGDLRIESSDGKIISKPGSDSCDYIYKDSLERVPFFCDFYNANIDYLLKKIFKNGNDIDIRVGNKYFENLTIKYPVVYHMSWFNLERKIRFFKEYWKDFWSEMYGNKLNDLPENNVMFNKSWSDVSEEDIKIAANEFEQKLSGWIWHQKWNGQRTFGLDFNCIKNIKNDLEILKENFGEL